MSGEIRVVGTEVSGQGDVLSTEALDFVMELHQRFGPAREEVLLRRQRRQDEAARTGRLEPLPETADIRSGDWQVAPAPADLRRRRVEITGPTDRKMMINALNSGADVWLADLEDANTPHWHNVVAGQANLRDAVRRTAGLTSPDGRVYSLRTDRKLPTVIVRPRGWHLPERHILIGDRPAIGALVDFGLYFYHNARALLDSGSGPYFYLPKLESHREARLWNEIFSHAENSLSIQPGTIRATVLIETIPAAFEMSEILFELREHASGLNAGRWDYLFSIIKYFREAGPSFVLPDRDTITMRAPFMQAYADLLVKTCHAHGAFAMGGMAAFIPSRRDPVANAEALAKVRADKEREAAAGFDGSWVAHPDLVPLCAEVFDRVLAGAPNQVGRQRADVQIDPASLIQLAGAGGEVTARGLRANISVGVRYLSAWLSGNGAAAIDNLMEDAATAEISRSQVWQWTHAGVRTADSDERISAELVRGIVAEVVAGLADDPQASAAGSLFEQVALSDQFTQFLTLPAYELID